MEGFKIIKKTSSPSSLFQCNFLICFFRFVKKLEHSWKALVHDGVRCVFLLVSSVYKYRLLKKTHICSFSGHGISTQARFLLRQISEVHVKHGLQKVAK